MPIAASDIKWKLSTTAGSAGNSNPQANPNDSLGKYISTTEIVDATLNNLFDDISGDENVNMTVDYRCIFIHNSHASLTYISPVVWISSEVSGGANAAIGVDPAVASDIGSSSAQAAEIADENSAPAGVTFSSPTTKGTGLALGNLAPGQCRAVWIRRTATNSAPINNDGVTLRVEGDTMA
jgi:hypothetical protein